MTAASSFEPHRAWCCLAHHLADKPSFRQQTAISRAMGDYWPFLTQRCRKHECHTYKMTISKIALPAPKPTYVAYDDHQTLHSLTTNFSSSCTRYTCTWSLPYIRRGHIRCCKIKNTLTNWWISLSSIKIGYQSITGTKRLLPMTEQTAANYYPQIHQLTTTKKTKSLIWDEFKHQRNASLSLSLYWHP